MMVLLVHIESNPASTLLKYKGKNGCTNKHTLECYYYNSIDV